MLAFHKSQGFASETTVASPTMRFKEDFFAQLALFGSNPVYQAPQQIFRLAIAGSKQRGHELELPWGNKILSFRPVVAELLSRYERLEHLCSP